MMVPSSTLLYFLLLYSTMSDHMVLCLTQLYCIWPHGIVADPIIPFEPMVPSMTPWFSLWHRGTVWLHGTMSDPIVFFDPMVPSLIPRYCLLTPWYCVWPNSIASETNGILSDPRVLCLTPQYCVWSHGTISDPMVLYLTLWHHVWLHGTVPCPIVLLDPTVPSLIPWSSLWHHGIVCSRVKQQVLGKLIFSEAL